MCKCLPTCMGVRVLRRWKFIVRNHLEALGKSSNLLSSCRFFDEISCHTAETGKQRDDFRCTESKYLTLIAQIKHQIVWSANL